MVNGSPPRLQNFNRGSGANYSRTTCRRPLATNRRSFVATNTPNRPAALVNPSRWTTVSEDRDCFIFILYDSPAKDRPPK